MSNLSSAYPSTGAGESAAAPPPAVPAAAAPSGAWAGPAEGPTVGVQVPALACFHVRISCASCALTDDQASIITSAGAVRAMRPCGHCRCR